MPTVWVVRAARENRLAPVFEEQGVVALGWSGLVGDLRRLNRWEVVGMLEQVGITSADEDADQLITFRDQLLVGDYVVTPDASRRGFLAGRISGPYEFHGNSRVVDPDDGPYEHVRAVEWFGHGLRDQLADHLRKELSSSRASLSRLGGSGEWPRVVEAVRDAPPPAPKAPRSSGSSGSNGSPRPRTTTSRTRAAAAPAPPTDRICPRCTYRKPNSQFVTTSDVCADCRADE